MEEKIEERGVLDCCTHLFCFECILKWGEVTNRCPLCKAQFRKIERQPPTGKNDVVTIEDKEQAMPDDGGSYMDPEEADWAAFVFNHSYFESGDEEDEEYDYNDGFVVDDDTIEFLGSSPPPTRQLRRLTRNPLAGGSARGNSNSSVVVTRLRQQRRRLNDPEDDDEDYESLGANRTSISGSEGVISVSGSNDQGEGGGGGGASESGGESSEDGDAAYARRLMRCEVEDLIQDQNRWNGVEIASRLRSGSRSAAINANSASGSRLERPRTVARRQAAAAAAAAIMAAPAGRSGGSGGGGSSRGHLIRETNRFRRLVPTRLRRRSNGDGGGSSSAGAGAGSRGRRGSSGSADGSATRVQVVRGMASGHGGDRSGGGGGGGSSGSRNAFDEMLFGEAQGRSSRAGDGGDSDDEIVWSPPAARSNGAARSQARTPAAAAAAAMEPAEVVDLLTPSPDTGGAANALEQLVVSPFARFAFDQPGSARARGRRGNSGRRS